MLKEPLIIKIPKITGIEVLRSKQWRTDPAFAGELGKANALTGIQLNVVLKCNVNN
jgi:hypothetical protein